MANLKEPVPPHDTIGRDLVVTEVDAAAGPTASSDDGDMPDLSTFVERYLADQFQNVFLFMAEIHRLFTDDANDAKGFFLLAADGDIGK